MNVTKENVTKLVATCPRCKGKLKVDLRMLKDTTLHNFYFVCDCDKRVAWCCEKGSGKWQYHDWKLDTWENKKPKMKESFIFR
jgi:hypothetical protein